MSNPPTPDERFALRQIDGRQGTIAWREAGQGLPLVLLHGIGSGSGSWLGQFEGLASSFRVIAWDAPGYGGSAPLSTPTPLAGDYAQVLAELIEALGLKEAVVLGHSLGAIVAGAWAADTTLNANTRRHALLLASPARGYGLATPAVRSAKYRERLDLLARLGIEGLAAQRSAGLCAPGASADVIAAVRLNMARATAGGYAQAAHLLAHDDLLTHLRQVKVPINVLCGELDRVTPPDACAELARAIGAHYRPLRGVAHACYVEDPAQFNAAVREALRTFVPAPQGAGHV